MIFISASYVKHDKGKNSIEELALGGFKNIELSGGTKYCERYKEYLMGLKDRYNLNYLLHNYFPPPKNDFMLNLASLNGEIYQKSLEHYEKAISLSRELGAKKFSFHAGYFIDFAVEEANKKIRLRELYDSGQAIKRFCEGYNFLKETAGDIELYIENNVLSDSNAKIFNERHPFMLTDYKGYEELKSRIDFKLLLDIAHLNVSANSLNVDFTEQLNMMLSISDYIHLSDNDQLHDQNACFSNNSAILNSLKNYDFGNKTITIETRGSVSDIKASQFAVQTALRLERDNI